MKIEIISGSPRINSVTRRVAIHLKKLISTTTEHEVDLIDMKDWTVPPVQTVWAAAEKAPIEFQSLAKRIFEADAYILVTPEYNGSYSPALKNLLDHFPKRNHMPFGIVTASPGAMGGMRASQQLLLLVPALFGIVAPNMLITPLVDKKFNEQGDLTDESFQNAIDNFISEFFWLAEKLVETPVEVLKN